MNSHSFLIIGLGNPGREHRENRHNVGFMLVDRLAVKFNVSFTRLQSKALVATSFYYEHKLILAKPQTYMNLSGQAVQGLVRFYKLPFPNLLVAHDDIDLPSGTLRIRPGGGSAGQKGIASIIECLRTQEFARLRLGVGRPPGRMDPADYVLQDFSDPEMSIISEALNKAVDAVLTFVSDGLEEAMNQFNGFGRDGNGQRE